MPCSVCGKPPPSDAHHWKTKGAGGRDEMSNLVSLCRTHHQEFHQVGVKTFYERFGMRMEIFRETMGLPPLEKVEEATVR